MIKRGENRGQVTIFIIIAIILIASVSLYFILREKPKISEIPLEFEGGYSEFLSCLENDLQTGVDVLLSQGGYIYPPEFEPGSRYMPFSSQLDFLGNGIPYWFYVSGNNLPKTEVPTISEMESQLERYINERIRDCDLNTFKDSGVVFLMEEPNSKVKIDKGFIEVSLDMPMHLQKGESKFSISSHYAKINSNLNNLYNAARKIFKKEQKDLFLENYTLDVLRGYAPVDGLEFGCSPKFWSASEIFQNLSDGLDANINSLKVSGDENDYFNIKNLEVDSNLDVRFLTSKNWPRSYEVDPGEGNFLKASPVGNQPGLGILGFCYIPYHFVYNIKYPVLIQISNKNSLDRETFQFPVAVIIEGNNPRKPKEAEASEVQRANLCKFKNSFTKVNVFDSNFNPVDAEISYECFGEVCSIGKSERGVLEDYFPQCVNGNVIVKADGFVESRKSYTSVNEGEVSVVLEREYELPVSIRNEISGNILISFISDDPKKSTTIVYPEQRSITLSEGGYNVSVMAYSNSEINFGKSETTQCVEVSSPGIAGLFGATKERCFKVEIPEQKITQVLVGGGKDSYYFLESELKNAKQIIIDFNKFKLPTSLEELQNNYFVWDSSKVRVSFK